MSNFETLNGGEWSEVYVFLKTLENGKLQGGNHKLNLIDNEFCTVISVSKKQKQSNSDLVYYIKENDIEVLCDDKFQKVFPKKLLKNITECLFNQITNNNNRTFEIPEVQQLLNNLCNPKTKASSYEKKDIILSIKEPITKEIQTYGFSIKSNLCKANSTLLNASKATNFVYVVRDNVEDRNLKAKKLLQQINNITYEKMDSVIFDNNLQMIDTQFPKIISEMLLYYYQGKATSLEKLIQLVQNHNPLKLDNTNIYRIKVGDFLLAIALGMMPNTKWNRLYDADGGMLVVREDGEIVSFYIFKQQLLEELKEYLIINSYFDTPSTTRHCFGKLYQDGNNTKVKLNLQIRLYPH